MTKWPTRKAVHMDILEQEYGATFFCDALAEYVTKFTNPELTRQAVERHAAEFPLPFQKLPVYHKAKFWLGDAEHHRLSSDEYDVIHAHPPHVSKRNLQIAGRFDTALVNGGTGKYISLEGQL